MREDALRRDPDSAALQNAVAWSLSILGRDLDRAFDLASRACEGPAALPEFLDTLAAVHLQRGDAAAALEAANRAVEIAGEPVPPRLLYMRAAALADAGRAREARVALAGCLEALGDDSPAWLPEAGDLAERLGLQAPSSSPQRL